MSIASKERVLIQLEYLPWVSKFQESFEPSLLCNFTVLKFLKLLLNQEVYAHTAA